MACCRTFASLMLCTALVATSVIIAGLPRSRAQESVPDARRQEQPSAQPNALPGQPPQAGGQLQLIFSPWTKFCLQRHEAHAKPVCFIGKDGRAVFGLTTVAVILIEPEGARDKVLRVTLPVGMDASTAVDIAIDQAQAVQARYLACLPHGCLADVAVGPDFVDGLKKGWLLTVEAKSLSGSATSFVLPLGGFARAYDGPPADPKVLARQQDDVRKPWKDDRLDPKIFRRSIQQ
jgi:invasion protein IalB